MLLEQITAFEDFRPGQHAFGAMAYALLQYRHPNVSSLPCENDQGVLLDPLLFAQLSLGGSDFTLDQLLFGYSDGSRRPTRIRVRSDQEGIIYLPNFGYLLTETRNATVELLASGGTPLIRNNTSILEYRFLPPVNVPGSTLEISRAVPIVLYPLFVDEENGTSDEVGSSVASQHMDHVLTAFDLLRHVYSAITEALLRVVRRAIIFRSAKRNSFACLFAHGAAFFNCDRYVDEVFFVEDILHQCGHILFSTMTFERESYFRVSPDTPVPSLGRGDERRSVYVWLHALFTEAAMAEGMNSLYESHLLTRRQRHELLGRIAFIMRRYEADLRSAGNLDVFTPRGLALFAVFRDVFNFVYERRKDDICHFSFIGQPYTFNVKHFEQANPVSL